MNIGHRSNRDSAVTEPREWQAQEDALRDERQGVEAPDDDTTAAQYRRIARALRQPPAAWLPESFARDVARAAALQASPLRAEGRFEQIVLQALVAVLAVSGTISLAMYGRILLDALGAQAGVWTFALVACVALSWSAEWMRKRMHHGGDLHHG